jgi:hypothetical protein
VPHAGDWKDPETLYRRRAQEKPPSQHPSIIEGECSCFLAAAAVLATDSAVETGEIRQFNLGLANLHGLVAPNPVPDGEIRGTPSNLQTSGSFA